MKSPMADHVKGKRSHHPLWSEMKILEKEKSAPMPIYEKLYLGLAYYMRATNKRKKNK